MVHEGARSVVKLGLATEPLGNGERHGTPTATGVCGRGAVLRHHGEV